MLQVPFQPHQGNGRFIIPGSWKGCNDGDPLSQFIQWIRVGHVVCEKKKLQWLANWVLHTYIIHIYCYPENYKVKNVPISNLNSIDVDGQHFWVQGVGSNVHNDESHSADSFETHPSSKKVNPLRRIVLASMKWIFHKTLYHTSLVKLYSISKLEELSIMLWRYTYLFKYASCDLLTFPMHDVPTMPTRICFPSRSVMSKYSLFFVYNCPSVRLGHDFMNFAKIKV